MATSGHIAVGMVAGRRAGGRRLVLAMLGFTALSLLPDADVLGFMLGVPYASQFGHRGATHSLAFALLVGLVVAAWVRRFGSPVGLSALKSAGLATLVVASHPLLDLFTAGGLGVALLWPLSDARFLAPVRPLPAAPIGWQFLSLRALGIMTIELVWFIPLFGYALWPRRVFPKGQ